MADGWTDLDESWAIASHHVLDITAVMQLPWRLPLPNNGAPLPSNGALSIQQLCSVKFTVIIMGVWRPNARTNFDEIWYTTANYDYNDSHVIKY